MTTNLHIGDEIATTHGTGTVDALAVVGDMIAATVALAGGTKTTVYTPRVSA